MTEEDGIETTFRCFNARSFRDRLGIPTPIWNEMEPAICEKVNEIRAKLKQKRPNTPPRSSKSEIPAQYPTMKSKDTIANLVNSLGDMDLGEDSDTDDDILQTSAYMVKQKVSIDPCGDSDGELEIRTHLNLDPPSDVIDLRAHFEYEDSPHLRNVIYAISDGGADSCILGKHAKSYLILEGLLIWLDMIQKIQKSIMSLL